MSAGFCWLIVAIVAAAEAVQVAIVWRKCNAELQAVRDYYHDDGEPS